MTATAFTIRGAMADGTHARRGVAAADPAVLPIGSRILVKGAGAYSGYYIVKDTGNAIHGQRLDLFIPTIAAARKFGRRVVTVRLLRIGRPVRGAGARSRL